MTTPREGSPHEPIDASLDDLFDGRTDPASTSPTPEPAADPTHTEPTATETSGTGPAPEADADDRTRRTKLTHRIAGFFVDRTIRHEFESHHAAHNRKESRFGKESHVDTSDPLGLAAQGAKARAGVYGDPKTDPDWDWFKGKGYATRMADTRVTRSANTLRRKMTKAEGNDPMRPDKKLSSKLGQPSKVNRLADSIVPVGNKRADRITDAHAAALRKILETNNDALDASHTAQGHPTYEIVGDDRKARPGEILHNKAWADAVLDPANVLELKQLLIAKGMEKGFAKNSLEFQLESSGIMRMYPNEIASYLGISNEAWRGQTGRDLDPSRVGDAVMPETGGANHKIVDSLNLMMKLSEADLALLVATKPEPKEDKTRKKDEAAETKDSDPMLKPMDRVAMMTSLREPTPRSEHDSTDHERLHTPDGTPWESVLSFVAGRYRDDEPGISFDKTSVSSVAKHLGERINFFDKAAKHLGYTGERLDSITTAERQTIEEEAAKIQTYLAEHYITELQTNLIIATEETPGEGYKVLKSNEQIMHTRAAYQAKRIADREAARAKKS